MLIRGNGLSSSAVDQLLRGDKFQSALVEAQNESSHDSQLDANKFEEELSDFLEVDQKPFRDVTISCSPRLCIGEAISAEGDEIPFSARVSGFLCGALR